ncbi:MAG: ACT domain-containing protein [Methanosphaera sp.]|nr:ACT domain-containing protein [Methanosphaera sp.]
MWSDIIHKFSKYPAQQKVVSKILELGLNVGEDHKLYCNDVEVNISSLAKSIDADRRAVTSTINTILCDEQLTNIFKNIKTAGPLLSNIANQLELGVIEIEGESQKAGVLRDITRILAKENISIRQAYVSDPEIDDTPHVTIVTDKPLDGSIIPLLLELDTVSKVSLS